MGGICAPAGSSNSQKIDSKSKSSNVTINSKTCVIHSCTVRPRSSYQFYIVSYYIKLVAVLLGHTVSLRPI